MIYQSGGEKHELGTAFLVIGEMRKRVIGWWPINERMCRVRLRGRFFNLSIINVHSPHLGSTDDDKENFYTQLEREYDRCPQHYVKIDIGDFNAQVGQEEVYKPTIGSFSAHQLTNDNGLRLVNFVFSKHMTIRSTFFQHAPRFRYTWRSPQQTYSQIDHVLIDGRHFSDIIDVRTYRGANVDSDHFLVMVKLRQKLSVANKLRYQPTPRLNTNRLRQANVARDCAIAFGEALPEDTITEAKSLNDHWCIVEQAISSTAERTIGRVTRNQRKEWFDDECRRALSEKNAERTRMLQCETRQNVENYKRLRRQHTRLFQEKKCSFEESDKQLMQQLCQSGETRQFYRMLNAARSGFTPMIAMCRNVEGDILSDE
ncbi:craniofacial development protein 2-like [Anopheles moucheti]|uniref:craniofacial development protein 2-like n=1 Tax=Anopheles moucheti TaxID=186751 RepID=UPI0022F010A8|nr:craniofacial development protein 2-like [Anopheles moucheti]